MTPRHAHLTELLERAGSGDVDAFADFYDATVTKVFALATIRAASRGSAEDVVREAYLRAWGRAGVFNLSGLSPTAWIVCMAGRHDCATDPHRGFVASGPAPLTPLLASPPHTARP